MRVTIPRSIAISQLLDLNHNAFISWRSSSLSVVHKVLIAGSDTLSLVFA